MRLAAWDSTTLLDVVLLQQVAELPEAQAEELGRVFLDTARPAQRLQDVFALDPLHVLLEIEAARQREVLGRRGGGASRRAGNRTGGGPDGFGQALGQHARGPFQRNRAF